MIKVYNTLSRQLEAFVPQQPGAISMYVCGPTVYNYIHIGNARSVVAFDVIRRYFEYRGFAVNFVSNFTDVDDKIIRRAAEEKMSVASLSDKYIAAFYADIDRLSVARATANPRATDYIYPMIDFIQTLLDKGFAYQSAGDVYFRVAKAHDYGKLAGKNLAELVAGASGRVTKADDAKKESPADFALWKAAKTGEISWQSPWSKGRPGWHLECSVMATKLLGATIDIHGGGADLEFPHHTNEIAQSEAATGQPFAHYWLHNGFVNINGEKMSKSLGNFKTVHEMLAAGLKPQVLRFFLASTHYRRPLDFTDEALAAAENNLKKIENAYRNIDLTAVAAATELTGFEDAFTAAMDEDFNIANGLSVFYDFLSWVNKGNGGAAVKAFFDAVLEILGLSFDETTLEDEIARLIERRDAARARHDFQTADAIRDSLKARGITLEDTPQGVRWHQE